MKLPYYKNSTEKMIPWVKTLKHYSLHQNIFTSEHDDVVRPFQMYTWNSVATSLLQSSVHTPAFVTALVIFKFKSCTYINIKTQFLNILTREVEH